METTIQISDFRGRAAARLYKNNRVQTPGADHKASKGPIGEAYTVSLSSAVQSHLGVMARAARA